MRVSSRLPVIAALGVLCTAGGVQLGRSAVAEIDPIYYMDHEQTFHADVVPYRSVGAPQPQAAASAQDPADGLGTGCVGCRPVTVQYSAWIDDSEGGGGGWIDEPAYEPPVSTVSETPYEAQPEPRWAEIERYATYRVSEDEPEQQPVEEVEPAEAEPVGL